MTAVADRRCPSAAATWRRAPSSATTSTMQTSPISGRARLARRPRISSKSSDMPELPAGVGEEVEAAAGGLGAPQGGTLGIEQAAALHRARAEPGERGDERLPVGGEGVGVVPGEAQHAEPPPVDLERHGGDRALLGRLDPEPAERGPVAGEVDGRVLDEHGLAGPRHVGGRQRQVERDARHRARAGVRVAPPGDRREGRLAGLDQEHGRAVGAQGGDAARHQQVGDLGRRQRAGELGGQGLEGLEPAGGDPPVASPERRPAERVRRRRRDHRDRGSEAGGQPTRDRFPARLHGAEMVTNGLELDRGTSLASGAGLSRGAGTTAGPLVATCAGRGSAARPARASVQPP